MAYRFFLKLVPDYLAVCVKVNATPAELSKIVAKLQNSYPDKFRALPFLQVHSFTNGVLQGLLCQPVNKRLDGDYNYQVIPGGTMLCALMQDCPGFGCQTGPGWQEMGAYIRKRNISLVEEPWREMLTPNGVVELQAQLFLPYWLKKLEAGVLQHLGQEKTEHLMAGMYEIDPLDGPAQSIWIANFLPRLKQELKNPDGIRDILNNCSHQQPGQVIAKLKERYAALGSVPALVKEMQSNNYYQGAPFSVVKHKPLTLSVVKVPRDRQAWQAATTSQQKKAAYCHCALIAPALKDGAEIPAQFCHCGGGWYKSMWQQITGKNVTVTPVTTILAGHDVCRFEIAIEDI